MAITDIFKKESEKKSAVKVEGKPVAAKKKAAAKPASKNSGRVVRILVHAHITEKASTLSDGNQYVFRVAKSANKKEIARAVEEYYQVKAIGVNVINVCGKRRRNRHGIFFEPGYRKAIVKIEKGQTIEIMPK